MIRVSIFHYPCIQDVWIQSIMHVSMLYASMQAVVRLPRKLFWSRFISSKYVCWDFCNTWVFQRNVITKEKEEMDRKRGNISFNISSFSLHFLSPSMSSFSPHVLTIWTPDFHRLCQPASMMHHSGDPANFYLSNTTLYCNCSLRVCVVVNKT